jgi:hypothetical protein
MRAEVRVGEPHVGRAPRPAPRAAPSHAGCVAARASVGRHTLARPEARAQRLGRRRDEGRRSRAAACFARHVGRQKMPVVRTHAKKSPDPRSRRFATSASYIRSTSGSAGVPVASKRVGAGLWLDSRPWGEGRTAPPAAPPRIRQAIRFARVRGPMGGGGRALQTSTHLVPRPGTRCVLVRRARGGDGARPQDEQGAPHTPCETSLTPRSQCRAHACPIAFRSDGGNGFEPHAGARRPMLLVDERSLIRASPRRGGGTLPRPSRVPLRLDRARRGGCGGPGAEQPRWPHAASPPTARLGGRTDPARRRSGP